MRIRAWRVNYAPASVAQRPIADPPRSAGSLIAGPGPRHFRRQTGNSLTMPRQYRPTSIATTPGVWSLTPTGPE